MHTLRDTERLLDAAGELLEQARSSRGSGISETHLLDAELQDRWPPPDPSYNSISPIERVGERLGKHYRKALQRAKEKREKAQPIFSSKGNDAMRESQDIQREATYILSLLSQFYEWCVCIMDTHTYERHLCYASDYRTRPLNTGYKGNYNLVIHNRWYGAARKYDAILEPGHFGYYHDRKPLFHQSEQAFVVQSRPKRKVRKPHVSRGFMSMRTEHMLQPSDKGFTDIEVPIGPERTTIHRREDHESGLVVRALGLPRWPDQPANNPPARMLSAMLLGERAIRTALEQTTDSRRHWLSLVLDCEEPWWKWEPDELNKRYSPDAEAPPDPVFVFLNRDQQ